MLGILEAVTIVMINKIHEEDMNFSAGDCFKWGQWFPGGSDGKDSVWTAGNLGSIPGWGRSPGEGTATHSNTLAWRIPWTEEPGWLQSIGVTESDVTELLLLSPMLSKKVTF